MTGKIHKLGGVMAGMAFSKLYGADATLTAIILAGAVTGSLLPDIDHPRSTISKKLWMISWPLSIMRWGVKRLSSVLPRKEQQKINCIVGHRGITHSLLSCISVACGMSIVGAVLHSCLEGYFSYYLCLVSSIVLGMFSHLMLDMLSNGVPLFCPFNNRRIGVKWIKTGSLVEELFAVLLLVIIVLLSWKGVLNG